MKHSTKNDVKKKFSNEALEFSKIFTHLLLDSSSAMFVTNIEEENQKKLVRRTSCKVKSKQRKEVIICLSTLIRYGNRIDIVQDLCRN